MAVFGHSGSHAPQLMHSLVITVAIASLTPNRDRWNISTRLPHGNVTPSPAGCTRRAPEFSGVGSSAQGKSTGNPGDGNLQRGDGSRQVSKARSEADILAGRFSVLHDAVM